MTADVQVQNNGMAERSTAVDQNTMQANGTMLATQASVFGVLNIIALFFEILKMTVNQSDQEKLARQAERQQRIDLMEKMVAACKSLAKQQLISGFVAGGTGLLSGVIPIAFYLKGDSIISQASKVDVFGWKIFGSFAKFRSTAAKPNNPLKLGKNLAKMMESSSTTSASMERVFSTKTEGAKYELTQKGDMHREYGEDGTRTVEEIREGDRRHLGFIDKILDMDLRAAPAA